MIEQAEDFRSESRALAQLVARLEPAAFDMPTLFKGWSANDILQHLHFWNRAASRQLTDPGSLQAELETMVASGLSMREFERTALSNLSGAELVSAWQRQAEETADLFAAADPSARLIWAGPAMSARSSITARQMETWAHGQALYDLMGEVRINYDRIRNIVVLGVNTFGWCYKTRGQEPPGRMPRLVLTAPSGNVWTYGAAEETDCIEGLAEEFCQVVTQTRNIADTALSVRGAVAIDWMSKAQCFAGPPSTPPAPGARHMQRPSPIVSAIAPVS